MNKYLKLIVFSISSAMFGNCAGATGALVAWFWKITAENCAGIHTGGQIVQPMIPGLRCPNTPSAPQKKIVCKSCRPALPGGNTPAIIQTDSGQVPLSGGYPTTDLGGGVYAKIDLEKLRFIGSGVTINVPNCRLWQAAGLGNQYSEACGVQLSNLSAPYCLVETCWETMEVEVAGRNSQQVGYDLAATEPPPGVKSLTPPNNSIIYENEPIQIEFTDSLKSDFLTITSNVNAALRNDYRLTRKVNYNDSLKLETNPRWPLGSFKNFVISSTDLNDKPVSVPLNFHVIKVGSSKTPSYGTCEGGCKISWNGASEIQFEASGGVPPYTWRAITNPPPELAHLNLPNGSMPPSASFSNSGFFRSTGTWNFLPNAKWGAVILVTDSIGQTDFKIIQFDSYDEAATLAACLLSGACG